MRDMTRYEWLARAIKRTETELRHIQLIGNAQAERLLVEKLASLIAEKRAIEAEIAEEETGGKR
jgi:hypothetical protein